MSAEWRTDPALSRNQGQGADLLETRVWDDRASGEIEV